MITRANLAEQLRDYQLRSQQNWASLSFFSSTANISTRGDAAWAGFGVPLEVLSDRERGFGGDLVGEVMKKLKIKRKHSTPYYPQCNGLVEKINGMICKIIKKQVITKPKEWDKHLEVALWSYRTSFKTSLGYSPYHLVFGKEAILPIEVQLASLRVLASGRETPKEQLQQQILDLERLELYRTSAIEFYAT
ncbi:hypothetical protein L7F22_015851 [Adiantum nelumboides]|nr:hypothetical protein [Adiantum nelumboides]